MSEVKKKISSTYCRPCRGATSALLSNLPNKAWHCFVFCFVLNVVIIIFLKAKISLRNKYHEFQLDWHPSLLNNP